MMRTLTERWDGTAWNVVSSPTVPEGALLDSVAAGNADQVWAVGWRQQQTLRQPLALRWNGARWSTVATPPSTTSPSWEQTTPGSWGSGQSRSHAHRPLGRHLVGAGPSADPGPIASSLTGVAAVPGTGCLWAVGQYTQDGGASRALVERYCSP